MSINPTICSPCPSDCINCTSSSHCTSCKVAYANPTNMGTCICNETAYLYNNTCTCSKGYYIDCYPNCQTSSLYYCNACNKACSECIAAGTTGCTSCSGLLSFDSNHSCSQCPDGMYNSDSVCLNCSSDCATCSSYDFCLTCSQTRKTANITTGVCSVVCNTRQYELNDWCYSCPYLCLDCVNSKTCEKCADNASWAVISCACNIGYEASNGTCTEKYFIASISVNSNNKVKLSFNEPPTVNFILSHFSISINGTNSYSVTFYQISATDYLFTLQFTTSIQAGTQINITILPPLVNSTLRSQLQYYLLNSTLSLYNPAIMSPTAKAITKTTAAASSAMVSTSIGAGLVGNPAATWILINSIKIISYIPINSNPLTPDLSAFFTALGGFNIMPNPITYIFDNNSTSDPYAEASNYGIQTSVFWINFGPSAFTLLLYIAVWPLVYLLSKVKIGKIAAKFAKYLAGYRYSLFLRFWIVSYLDIGFFAIIQLKAVSFI